MTTGHVVVWDVYDSLLHSSEPREPPVVVPRPRPPPVTLLTLHDSSSSHLRFRRHVLYPHSFGPTPAAYARAPRIGRRVYCDGCV